MLTFLIGSNNSYSLNNTIFNWSTKGTSSGASTTPLLFSPWSILKEQIFQGLILDWSVHTAAATVATPNSYSIWTLGTNQLPFDGVMFTWGSPSSLYGNALIHGGTGNNTGNIQLIMSGDSLTLGTVQAYNDGKINISKFTVKTQFPVKQACQLILQQTGAKAANYKLDVIQHGVVEFTVRSIKWGSLQTMAQDTTDDQLINNHYLDTGQAPD